MIQDDKLPMKEKYLEYYRELPIQKLAAGKIGRDEDTILRWKKEDTDFADQEQKAKSEWALLKTKQVKSKEWLLERVMKDHFSQRNELTGKDGQDLIPKPIVDLPTHVPENNSNQ